MSAHAYFDALVRHETAVWNAVEKRMRGVGVLSLARLEVLRVIDAQPEGVRVNDVAEAVGTSVAAASRLLDRLAGDGIVDRSVDPDDRRGVRVTLTDAGSDSLREARDRFDAALTSALDGVDPEAIAQGLAALRRVEALMEAQR